MHERWQVEPEQILRPQRGDLPGAIDQNVLADDPDVGEARQ